MTGVSDGFLRPTTTPTPDEVFDVWLSKLSGAELKVLLYVVRRTFGFKKDSDAISLNQICQGITTRDGRVLDRGTGLARSTASAAVKQLEGYGLIGVERVQDEQRGFVTNVYRLRFRDAGGQDDEHPDEPEPEEEADAEEPDRKDDRAGSKTEPGVVRKSNQGSSERQPALVRKANPQQTASQETDRQQTGRQPPLPENEAAAAPPPGEAPTSQDAADEAVDAAGAGAGLSPVVSEIDSSSPEARDAPDPPPESERFEESVERLVAFGVWRTRAQKVVREWALAPEQVERACAALADEIKGGADFENPPALLLSRLRSGWEPHEIVKEEPPDVDGFEDDDDLFTDDWEIDEPVESPFPPIADALGREHDAEKWFNWLKGELQMQLPRETFNTWLRWAELSDYQPPSEAGQGP